MKKIYSLIIAGLVTFSVQAQNYCGGARYDSQTFSNYTITSNLQYGSNTSWNGSNVNLKLDVYQPQGDTAAKRPLIIWIHGGSFISGTKNDIDVVELSKRFAKRGYVCASIDYRTTFYPLDSANVTKALLRAVQDLKASLRYFYKDAKTTDCYKIDTTNIFVGGSSAGALTAIHAAYMDKSCEVEPYIPLSTINTMGGLYGTSGNPGYSSNFKAVLNLCGSIGRYNWIEQGDLPICSMHGTNDGTVPYGRDVANGFLYTDGSLFVNERAQQVGVTSAFYTWRGADHVPYAGTSANAVAYMDTTEKFVGNFVYSQLGCTPSLSPINTIPPTGSPNFYAFTPCSTNGAVTAAGAGYVATITCNSAQGITETGAMHLDLFPNPANTTLYLNFDNGGKKAIAVIDATGRAALNASLNDLENTIDISFLKSGLYMVTVNDGKEFKTVKFIKE